MNSGAKPRTGALFLGLLAAAFLAVVAVGCSDHGPTGLYSGALFGVNNGSANMVILTNYPSYEPSLTVTAGISGCSRCCTRSRRRPRARSRRRTSSIRRAWIR